MVIKFKTLSFVKHLVYHLTYKKVGDILVMQTERGVIMIEKILKSLEKVERIIYSVPYDELTPYLQGVRDMVNLFNGEEDSEAIAETVMSNMKKLEKEV